MAFKEEVDWYIDLVDDIIKMLKKEKEFALAIYFLEMTQLELSSLPGRVEHKIQMKECV